MRLHRIALVFMILAALLPLGGREAQAQAVESVETSVSATSANYDSCDVSRTHSIAWTGNRTTLFDVQPGTTLRLSYSFRAGGQTLPSHQAGTFENGIMGLQSQVSFNGNDIWGWSYIFPTNDPSGSVDRYFYYHNNGSQVRTVDVEWLITRWGPAANNGRLPTPPQFADEMLIIGCVDMTPPSLPTPTPRPQPSLPAACTLWASPEFPGLNPQRYTQKFKLPIGSQQRVWVYSLHGDSVGTNQTGPDGVPGNGIDTTYPLAPFSASIFPPPDIPPDANGKIPINGGAGGYVYELTDYERLFWVPEWTGDAIVTCNEQIPTPTPTAVPAGCLMFTPDYAQRTFTWTGSWPFNTFTETYPRWDVSGASYTSGHTTGSQTTTSDPPSLIDNTSDTFNGWWAMFVAPEGTEAVAVVGFSGIYRSSSSLPRNKPKPIINSSGPIPLIPSTGYYKSLTVVGNAPPGSYVLWCPFELYEQATPTPTATASPTPTSTTNAVATATAGGATLTPVPPSPTPTSTTIPTVGCHVLPLNPITSLTVWEFIRPYNIYAWRDTIRWGRSQSTISATLQLYPNSPAFVAQGEKLYMQHTRTLYDPAVLACPLEATPTASTTPSPTPDQCQNYSNVWLPDVIPQLIHANNPAFFEMGTPRPLGGEWQSWPGVRATIQEITATESLQTLISRGRWAGGQAQEIGWVYLGEPLEIHNRGPGDYVVFYVANQAQRSDFRICLYSEPYATATPTATSTATATPTPTETPFTTSTPFIFPTIDPTAAAIDEQACVPAPTPAQFATLGILPALAVELPPLPTIAAMTVTVSVSTTDIVSPALTVVAGMAEVISGPVTLAVSITSGYHYTSGKELALGYVSLIQPALDWVAILNPLNPGWNVEGNAMWAIAPLLQPFLPIILVSFMFHLMRFFLWLIDVLRVWVEFVIKLIELIPGM